MEVHKIHINTCLLKLLKKELRKSLSKNKRLYLNIVINIMRIYFFTFSIIHPVI